MDMRNHHGCGRRPGAFLLLALLLLLLGPGRTGQAQGEAAPAAKAADAPGEGGARDGGGESFLRWMARSSGPIGVVILAMSFYLVALVVWMFLRFRPEEAAPRALVEEVADLLEHRQYERAFARVEGDGSFLARTLVAGVRKLPAGTAAAQRAMELANEERTMAMEHRTTYLATVGTLGPMIGLVGTVYGMIRSFQVIATMGSSPQASQLASGISTALFATLLGIAISVPAIAFYAYFRNRIARLSLEVQIVAEGLLDGFAPGVRSLHPAGGGGASGGVPPLPNRPALPPRPE
jgi:biopolymer transport protein ExbB